MPRPAAGRGSDKTCTLVFALVLLDAGDLDLQPAGGAEAAEYDGNHALVAEVHVRQRSAAPAIQAPETAPTRTRLVITYSASPSIGLLLQFCTNPLVSPMAIVSNGRSSANALWRLPAAEQQ